MAPSLIDGKAKDDFLELIISLLEKIIFMEDPGFSIPKTILYIAYFEPKSIGFFLDRLKRAFANINDLSFATVKSILIFLI